MRFRGRFGALSGQGIACCHDAGRRRMIRPKMAKCKWRLDAGQIEVVDDAVAEVLRRKTPAEKVAMISAANRTMRSLIEGHVRGRHADWDSVMVQREVARRMTRGAD